MKQSKIPAKCHDCSKNGPKRSEAAKQGWERERTRHGKKPLWRCSKCAEIKSKKDREEARRQYEEDLRDPRKLQTRALIRTMLMLGM